MRYLHNNADELVSYIQTHDLAVTKCDCSGVLGTSPADTGAIEDMLSKSNTLYGSLLPYYFVVSGSTKNEASPLKDAVSNIETSLTNDSFLVAAYEDGGILSVSSKTLPFQITARPADWWRPSKT